ncbi:N-acetylneuraminate synthase [Succinivibrio dextrinosolvens]|uniref:N-acetylneuraminate synthase n=1 Tax=Succinivibrio dextrinosolvens TaxID=83771 RepID=A0A662ZDT7_9GAMM|nr:N-acetylneuraminate synthase [Succinivibrio dextrinosolvens]SFK46228.1 N-acetylneuraminate synthase [Succinivibrio dextrinosolvens]
MNKTLIIAEAGVNHNGDINIAKRLVDEAKKAGADIVKFQTFVPELLSSKKTKMANYQKKNLGEEDSQLNMLRKLALSFDSFVELSDYCKKIGIKFLSTPFDLQSISFLDNLQDIWKIPSGEITNYPYLVEIAKTNKPVILSTGMCSMEEIEESLNVLRDHGSEKISILHCNTQYPTPYCDVNLKAMNTLMDKFGVKVGYSDHTLGIEVPIAAVALGAEIIEKHFTLDRSMDGPDHKASLEPKELADMVRAIRNIEKALGDGEKRVTESERANLSVARKSIVAKIDIKKGEIFSDHNLTTKRPGTGISPMKWNSVIGTVAIRDFQKDELIEL